VDEYHYSDASDRFVTEYSDFNIYDVACKTKRSGGLKTRYTTQWFVHDTANWVLNLTKEVTVGDSEYEANQTSLKKSITTPIHPQATCYCQSAFLFIAIIGFLSSPINSVKNYYIA